MVRKWERLLLITPDLNDYVSYWRIPPSILPNLGLEYLQSNVIDIISVRLLDLRLYSVGEQKHILETYFQRYKPDLVGIYSLTPFFQKVIKIAKIAKKFKCQVIVGGWHATLYPEDCIQPEPIDMIVRGEGEITLRELLISRNPEGIAGISYKRAGEIIHNPDRQLESDLNTFKFPLRNSRKVEYYRSFFMRIDEIITSRGCPHYCNFCPTPLFYKGRYRARSVENVMEELDQISKLGMVREVVISDDNFTTNPKFVEKFCDEVIRRKYKFQFRCLSRADFLARYPELVKKMHKAGFWMIFIGFESFSQNILDDINKGEDFRTYVKAIYNLKTNNIIVQGNFIIGGSLEATRADFLNSLKWINKLGIDILSFSYLNPQPNTALMKNAREQHLFLGKDFEYYNLLEPLIATKYLQEQDLKELMIYAHKSIPLTSKIPFLLMKFIQIRGIRFFFGLLRIVSIIKELPHYILAIIVHKINFNNPAYAANKRVIGTFFPSLQI